MNKLNFHVNNGGVNFEVDEYKNFVISADFVINLGAASVSQRIQFTPTKEQASEIIKLLTQKYL